MKNLKLEEFNKSLKGKKVGILGLGVSNLPLIDYLYEYGANIYLFDEKEYDKLDSNVKEKINKYNLKCNLGNNCMEDLKNFDIIFRSPSILPTRKELVDEASRGCLITTEIEMLMKLIPSKIIGITGSDGKTTTTTLISECLKANGYNVYVGGNIGTPLFTKANEMTEEDIVVLELSSFQLMGMTVSPNISVITNITPNHLNIHKDMEEYILSKRRIIDNQNKDDVCVLNYNDEIVKDFSNYAKGEVRYFSKFDNISNGFCIKNNAIYRVIDNNYSKIIDTKDVLLRGNHNYENICTCLSAIIDLIDINKATKVFKSFKGVEHRLEFIREINGVKWYNDSVSSSPTRTIAGLNSYDENIVLIAGGYDKHIDYDVIGEPIVNKVSTLILMGDTKEKIYNATVKAEEKLNKKVDKYMVSSLEEAVNLALNKAKIGEVVLFSPASASFDMFKNFADRGENFKTLVNQK